MFKRQTSAQEGLLPVPIGRSFVQALPLAEEMPFEVVPREIGVLGRGKFAAVVPTVGKPYPSLVVRFRDVPPPNSFLNVARGAFTTTWLFHKEPVEYTALLNSLTRLYKLARSDNKDGLAAIISAIAQEMFAGKNSAHNPWVTNTVYAWGDERNFSRALAHLMQTRGLRPDLPVITSSWDTPLKMWLFGGYYSVTVKDMMLSKMEDIHQYLAPKVRITAPHVRSMAGKAYCFFKVLVLRETVEQLLRTGDLLMTLRWDAIHNQNSTDADVNGNLHVSALLRTVYDLTPEGREQLRVDQDQLMAIGGVPLMGAEIDSACAAYLPGAGHLDPNLAGTRILGERAETLKIMESQLTHPSEKHTVPIGLSITGQPMVVSEDSTIGVMFSGATTAGKTVQLSKMLLTHPRLDSKGFTYLTLGDSNRDDPFLTTIGSKRHCGGFVLRMSATQFPDPDTAQSVAEVEAAVRDYTGQQFAWFLDQVRLGNASYPFGLQKDAPSFASLVFVDEWTRLTLSNWDQILSLSGVGHHALAFDELLTAYQIVAGEAHGPVAERLKVIMRDFVARIDPLPNKIRHRDGLLYAVLHQPEAANPHFVNQFSLQIDIPADRTRVRATVPAESGREITDTLNIHSQPGVLHAMGVPIGG